MNNLKSYLKETFSFTSDEIEQISTCFRLQSFSKKEFFLKQGQYCKTIGFIESGGFIYYQNVDGEEKVCDFGFENDWVTQYKSLLGNLPSDMNIRSIGKTELLITDMAKMQELSKTLPKVTIIRSTMAEQYFTKSNQRATNFTTLDAKGRYEALLNEIPFIHQRVPQYHIASYLGIKPQSLSRIRAEK